VHLTGQYSNPSGPLKALLEAIFQSPDEEPRPTSEARVPVLPRLRWGAIQAAVLIVLGEAERPMRVREIHALVEDRLKLKVSYHTVCSFLIAAGKSRLSGVERVRYGTYRASPRNR
jgi:hypothetical protein